MLEQIKYVNHMNETLEMDRPKLFVQSNGLHDFTWGVNSKNDKISGFKRGVYSKSFSLVVKGNSEKECFELCNRLFDVMEKDILSVRHGKLIIGGYYLKCYIVESKKTEYLRAQGYMKISLKVTTDHPFWVKEVKSSFGYGIGNTPGKNLDFNRDFPSDYASNLIGKKLVNAGFVDSNFRIVIYGPCEMPGITIAGHLYEVRASVAENEHLVIDSSGKTIVLTHRDGRKENCFNLRNRDSYIFEKIPPGLSNVSANNDLKFDVVLLEERSEPKWT